MFTGLIQNLSTIDRVSTENKGLALILKMPVAWGNDLTLGESIAVNGVCLTLESFDPNHLRFFVGPESLQVTTLGLLKAGDAVNLERSLRVGDRLGGHWVSGHVDGIAKACAINDEGASRIICFEIPASLIRWVIPKGSIAFNGVSLTVNVIEKNKVSVCLIPETLQRTNLSDLKEGALVHVECDQLAKMVQHYVSQSKELLLR